MKSIDEGIFSCIDDGREYDYEEKDFENVYYTAPSFDVYCMSTE